MTVLSEAIRSKIIVAADDFGRNQKANQNILELIGLGKIDRVAIMVDGQITAEEISRILASGVKTDIHLSLPKTKEKLTTKEGAAGRLAFFLFQFCSGKIKPSFVGKDWARQIEKFKRLLGKNPDGLNSHQHTHFFPPYFKIALSLTKRFNIPYLRFGKKGILEHKGSVARILNFLWFRNKKRFFDPNLASSDFLLSFDWLENPPAFFEKTPTGQTEIICHPERERELEFIRQSF